MNPELEDVILKSKVESVFIDGKKDMNQPNVLAAMITAASAMSRESDGLATPEMTTEQLLDLYGKTEDETVTSLIGMNPNFVRANIGYCVDFQDFSSAVYNYRAAKKEYDEIYKSISYRERTRANTNSVQK